MASEPPTAIQDFYDWVGGLDSDSLARCPSVLDLGRRGQNTPVSNPRLKHCWPKSMALHHNQYIDVQLAWFDFVGECGFDNCPLSKRHPHSVQASAVYEVEGFPGLYVYPEILSFLVGKKLLDQLLHRELSTPSTTTNLHDEYHVIYPEIPAREDTPTSFFDPKASHLKFQPRLKESWIKFPISIRTFIEKLRWIALALPTNIKSLVEAIFPLQLSSASAYISSTEDTRALRQEQGNQRPFVHVSLGCEGIFVIGRQMTPDEVQEAKPLSPNIDEAEDSWREHIVGLDDDYYTEREQHQRENPPPPTFDAPGFELAALRLKHGDALLFTGESARAWHGIAKVNQGTFKAWEEDWPCWFETQGGSRFQDWKGCMKGRRVDLILR